MVPANRVTSSGEKFLSKAKQKHNRARGRGLRHMHTRLRDIKPGGLSKMDLGLSPKEAEPRAAERQPLAGERFSGAVNSPEAAAP